MFIPFAPGQFLNAAQIVTIADAFDGTPIALTLVGGTVMTIDPTATPGLAMLIRHRLGYAPVPGNRPPPPLSPRGGAPG